MRNVFRSLLLVMVAGCGNDDSAPQASAGEASDGGFGPEASASEAAIEIVDVAVGELRFQVRTAGPADGEPVILLHGFPQTSLEWSAQISFLAARGYRVAAPDQRGYSPGARPGSVTDYAMLLLVRDVLGIADALEIERFHLVGHDWGASVAWATAFFAPERLLSIVPISVPHLDAYTRAASDPASCQPASSAYIASFLAEGSESALLRDDAAGLRRLYQGLSADRVDAYLAHFADEASLTGPLNWYRANLVSGQPRPSIGNTSTPTLYIWSDGDPSICRDSAELTAEYVTGPYRFEILAGVNHWVPELAPDDVNALLLEHLRAHPRPSE